jgi:hypothetical protein
MYFALIRLAFSGKTCYNRWRWYGQVSSMAEVEHRWMFKRQDENGQALYGYVGELTSVAG